MRLGSVLIAAYLVAGSAAATDIEQRLATASPERGARMAQVCKACHSLTEGAGPKVGPNLWGVIGKSVADAKDFADYSDAIKAFGGQWTVDRLDQFLSDPTGVVKGTIMVYPGIKNAERRADLIAYLNSNGPSPLVFAAPASAKQTDGAGSPAKPDSTKQFGMLCCAGRRNDLLRLHWLSFRADRRTAGTNARRLGRIARLDGRRARDGKAQ